MEAYKRPSEDSSTKTTAAEPIGSAVPVVSVMSEKYFPPRPADIEMNIVQVKNAMHAQPAEERPRRSQPDGSQHTTPTSSLDSDDAELFRHSHSHSQEIADRTPWRAFFTHPAALTLLVNNWTLDWIGFTLLSEMPSYLTEQLGFTSESAGLLSTFPYIALFLATLFYASFFEYMQLHHYWPARRVRQWAQFLTVGMSSAALLVCAFLPNRNAAYAFIVISQLFFGADASGIACAYSDVSPNYSEMLNSIGNTVGAFAGILGPIVVAGLLEVSKHSAWGWRGVFMLTAGFSAISLVLWRLYQTSDIVPELNNPVARKYSVQKSCLQVPLLGCVDITK